MSYEYIEKIVEGCYEIDQNFLTMYTEDMIYTCSLNSGNWGGIHVGDFTHMGRKLTPEIFANMMSACKCSGAIKLVYDEEFDYSSWEWVD